MSFEDINDLIDVYVEALEYDIKHKEPNCHDKHKHEELEDISFLLTKRLNHYIAKNHLIKAKETLELKMRVDKLIERLNEYADDC